jgi:hypothetical protein
MSYDPTNPSTWPRWMRDAARLGGPISELDEPTVPEPKAGDELVHMVDPIPFWPHSVCRAPMRSNTGDPSHGGATTDWARVTCADCLATLGPLS